MKFAMRKNFIKPLVFCLLLAASLHLAPGAFAATITKEEPDIDEGSNMAASEEAIMEVQSESETVEMNASNAKLLHEKEKNVLYDTIEDFRVRLVGVSLQESASKMQREAIEMPRFYEFVQYASDATVTNVAHEIQKQMSNITTLQYLIGQDQLGLKPSDVAKSKVLKHLFNQPATASHLAQRKNPYLASKEAAISAAYSSYVPYFCMQHSTNAPTGCGTLAPSVGPLATSLVSSLVGDATWSSDTITPSRDFFRVYFGLMFNTSRLSTKSGGGLIDYMKDATQASMRLSVLEELMSRRTAAISAGSNGNISGALLRTFEEAGYLSDNDPVSLCSNTGKRSPISAMLCEMLDKNFSASQAIVERVLQHDIYLTPVFLDDVNAREYPAKASLQRLEVHMTAQKLTQEYRFLRDLQMYTALRAMNISNGMTSSSN